jgi:hypothetical protein
LRRMAYIRLKTMVTLCERAIVYVGGAAAKGGGAEVSLLYHVQVARMSLWFRHGVVVWPITARCHVLQPVREVSTAKAMEVGL